LPTSAGNPVGLLNHPRAPFFSTYVYDVTKLQRPAFVITTGGQGLALAFDPKGKRVYSHNHLKQLILFDRKGTKGKEYKLGLGEPKLFMGSPQGNQLLLLSDRSLAIMELPSE